MLWNGTESKNGVLQRFNLKGKDRNMHPIPFVAGGPGVGKTWFLQEVKNLLYDQAASCDNAMIRGAFQNMVSVNITYGNGSAFCQMDQDLGGESSVAIRIIYNYFIDSDNPKETCDNFYALFKGKFLRIQTALNVVCLEYNQAHLRYPDVLVLGID